MDPWQPISAEAPGNAGPQLDPRLQPTPDYGSLGPGSDVTGLGAGSSPRPVPQRAARVSSLIAASAGVFVALVVGIVGRSHPAWPAMAKLLSPGQNQAAPAKDVRQLAEMQEQKQAETLLELAVAQKAGATEQISSHVDRWQGKLTWNSRMANLTAAALDSNDMRVREAGVEVELAAYGLAKNSASFQYVLQMMESDKHAEKMWALWALGLMGNRGVQQDQVIELLISHLKDSEEDSRRWAVEALALVGTDSIIEPLLRTMHDDPSPLVRERAGCSLAQSGMLTPEQRMSAVPQLLTYTDDASLDAPTHQWAFHALNDITHQHLPNDSAAWRSWYESTRQ